MLYFGNNTEASELIPYIDDIEEFKHWYDAVGTRSHGLDPE